MLYSEDLQNGQLIENRLAIVNPFASSENVPGTGKPGKGF